MKNIFKKLLPSLILGVAIFAVGQYASAYIYNPTDGGGGGGSGTVTSITATSPLTGGTITTTGNIGCQTASGSQSGCLSSTDWTDFDSKLDSGPITTSGLTMNTNRILGRSTASTGAVEEISVGSGLTLSGGTLSSTGGTPAGSNTQIQYNNAGAFGASPAFSFNNTTKVLQLTNGGSPAKRAFLCDGLNFDCSFGDISSGGNNTSFGVFDSSQNIQFLGGDGLGGTGAVLDIYTNLSAGNGAILNMGDVSNLVHGTLFEVNDISKYIRTGNTASGIKSMLHDYGSNVFEFGDYSGATIGSDNVGYVEFAPFTSNFYGSDSQGGVSLFMSSAGGDTYVGDINGTNNGVYFAVLDSAGGVYQFNGNTFEISTVPYRFPSTQGGAGRVLTNDGSGNLSWGSAGSGVTTVGTIDTATPSANGAVITGSSIFMQSASSTLPGLVNTTTQVFSGLKAFLTGIETTAGAITGTGGAGFLDFFSQSSTPSAPSSSFLRIWQQSNRFFFSRNGGIDASLDFNAISADRNYAFPDLAGTVALLTGAQTFTDKIISVVSGGNTTTQSRVGGSYATSTTATSNSGSGETNLFSTAIGANTLNTNGDKIRFKSAGTFNTSANNKRLRVKFGGTTIYDSTALAITTANSWIVEGEIIRSSSTAVKVNLTVSSSSALLAATTVYLPITGLTLSNSNNLDITGQGTASADMTGEMLSVDFMPN